MKKLLLTTLLLFSLVLCIQALCDPEQLFAAYEVNMVNCPNDVIRKQEKWYAYFPGYNTHSGNGIKEAYPYGHGWCQSNGNQCWPDFDNATITYGRDAQGRQTWKWKKVVHGKNLYCNRDPNGTREFLMNYTCPSQLAENCGLTPGWDGQCPTGTYPNGGTCCPGGAGGCNGVAAGAETAGLSADSPDSPPSLMPGGGLSCNSEWSWDGCQCVPSSPIVLDIAGDGFRLTDAAGGVSFDLNGDGVAERLSWTSTNSDDAWLALDRDGNGTVDDGRELFGNFTPQPVPPAGQERNGFRALALYDWTTNGGNGDGVIDAQDPVFSRLRVWQDTNHNGVSEAGELHRLSSVNVVSLRLAYKESKRADEHGNAFRYRAKIDDAKGAKAGGWAWDVFLVAAAR